MMKVFQALPKVSLCVFAVSVLPACSGFKSGQNSSASAVQLSSLAADSGSSAADQDSQAQQSSPTVSPPPASPVPTPANDSAALVPRVSPAPTPPSTNPPPPIPPDDSAALVPGTPAAQANLFDVYHPVAVHVQTDNEAGCETVLRAKAPDLPTDLLQCRRVGRLWDAYVLMPLPPDLRSRAQEVYKDQAVVFGKVVENAKFLRRLYKVFANREPDVAGFYFWLNEYYDSSDRRTPLHDSRWLVESILPNSPTYLNAKNLASSWHSTYGVGAREFIREMYLALFDRQADAEGEGYYYVALTWHQMSLDEFREELYGSDEFKRLTQGL